MFREKLNKDKSKRGYLYIRESVYKRDKRTLKKKPSKLGDGSATKERGKYSKKIDIYCGRIYEIKPVSIFSYKEFLKQKNNDYINFIIDSTYEILLNSFLEYIFELYDISKEQFFSKKQVYTIGDGYICKEIIKWLKHYEIKKDPNSKSEYERFMYRCSDCGIFDEDVANALFLKLVPRIEKEDIREEITNLQKRKDKKINFESLRAFLQND